MDKDFRPLSDSLNQIKTVSKIKVDFTGVVSEKTQVFVMTDEVALATEKLTHDPKFKAPSLSEIGFPYNDFIVEMPRTEAINSMLRHNIGERQLVVDGESVTQQVLGVKRVASHINVTKEDDRVDVAFWPFWEHEDGSFGFSSVQLFLSTHDLPGMLHRAYVIVPPANNTVQVAFMPSLPMLKMFHTASGGDVEKGAELIRRHIDLVSHNQDLIFEATEELMPLLFAWYVIMNVKSGVTKTEIQQRIVKRSIVGGRLGKKKASVKSRSKYTLISITAIEDVDAAKGVASVKKDIHAHYVRGHFKQRATGVFWWNHYVRGNGTPRNRDFYKVDV